MCVCVCVCVCTKKTNSQQWLIGHKAQPTKPNQTKINFIRFCLLPNSTDLKHKTQKYE